MVAHEIETVGVLGAGAMGGMYAAHFAAAGFPVTLVARGSRAARLAEHGVVVNGRRVEAAVFDAAARVADATPTPGGDRGPAPLDLVLVAVKHHELAGALDDLAPLVGPDTVFVSVLNGLDSEAVIADRFGGEHVLLCTAMAMDALREDGEVRYRQAGRLVLGEADNATVSPQVTRVQRALDRAGLAWQTPADMRRALWWKFLINVGVNQASAILRAPYGEFVRDGDARALMLALMGEVVAVANAEGVPLGADDLHRWDDVLAGQPSDGKTSMHQDVEAGRRTEVEIFAGRVVALGSRHGIATPYNQAALWILRGLYG